MCSGKPAVSFAGFIFPVTHPLPPSETRLFTELASARKRCCLLLRQSHSAIQLVGAEQQIWVYSGLPTATRTLPECKCPPWQQLACSIALQASGTTAALQATRKLMNCQSRMGGANGVFYFIYPPTQCKQPISAPLHPSLRAQLLLGRIRVHLSTLALWP